MKRTVLLFAAALFIVASCKDKKQASATSAPSEPVAMEATPEPPPPPPPLPASVEIEWMSITEAVAAQKKTAKPILVDVYTHWCGPCKMLAKNTFGDPRVASYMAENFYCVKFDAESPDTVVFAGQTYANPDYSPFAKGRNGVHQFTRYLNVSGYPTLFFFDKQANPVGPVVGYKTPAQIEIFLHYFAEEKFLTVRSPEEWQAYEKDFVVTWN